MVQKVGDYFAAKLEKLPHVKEVRHQGLLVGVEFDDAISGVDVKHGALDRSDKGVMVYLPCALFLWKK